MGCRGAAPGKSFEQSEKHNLLPVFAWPTPTIYTPTIKEQEGGQRQRDSAHPSQMTR